MALLLIQRGADVNAQTKSGWIPMHFAVNTGLLELVELLHSHGGRADIVNEWMKTPLDIAKGDESFSGALVVVVLFFQNRAQKR